VNCLFGILHGEGLRKEDDDEEPGIVDEPGILSNMVGCLPSQQLHTNLGLYLAA
jgi:hypothetical protein